MNDLRPYQVEILAELEDRLRAGETEICLAAPPGAGKTRILIEFMRARPESKFLIVCHGTQVIKDQWKAEFGQYGVEALDFDAGVAAGARIIYELPQTLEKRTLPAFDFVVYDEAHQYSQAAMGKRIRETVRPTAILYATATPSKFVHPRGGGLKPVVCEAMDLVKAGHLQFAGVHLFTTTAKLGRQDFGETDDLKAEGVDKLGAATSADIGLLVKAMVERLRGPLVGASKLRRLAPAVFAFGALKKTLIACASIAHAEAVGAELKSLIGADKVVVSHYENDGDSRALDAFKANGIQVLVVVDRGVLGYNMPGLVNVVDMSGTLNIDRIIQLYGRVTRVDAGQPKFFFKLAGLRGHQELVELYTLAALTVLYVPGNISIFNGKNLAGIEVTLPAARKPRERGEAREPGPRDPVREKPFDKDFMVYLNDFTFFEALTQKTTNILNEYARSKALGLIEAEITGKQVRGISLAAWVRAQETA